MKISLLTMHIIKDFFLCGTEVCYSIDFFNMLFVCNIEISRKWMGPVPLKDQARQGGKNREGYRHLNSTGHHHQHHHSALLLRVLLPS